MDTFDDILSHFFRTGKTSRLIQVEDIPNIDLYMDQVTTFMDKALGGFKRTEEDKVLTKTMINNYTKAKIFPPPIKKKYSRTHLMLLIMIYHLKSVLSIGDIGILFRPILEMKTYDAQEKMVLEIYGGFLSLQQSTEIYMKASLEGVPHNAFSEKEIIGNYDNELTKRILLVLMLVTHAYAEKKLAEQVLDLSF